ncbi:B12-binding domain-containing protein [Paenibacillus sp. JNUCC31]|uniref:B12-binding domain-containing protein n=1 Tax=Paenibacillus sp. JNUCC-31 TaxID=2777983 RepID=UPI00177C0DD4|nr:B12-binding domain-containing protein [Paenibacillus sp. JNUCC-31]QOS81474.1 B12-binding domain-containing protein [Paenibacillus sp. JNUCC-31]
MLAPPSVLADFYYHPDNNIDAERPIQWIQLTEIVEDLRWLKEQVEQHQTNISEAVRMLKANKTTPPPEAALPTPLTAPVPTMDEAYERIADQIYDSLYNFQGGRANGLIDSGFTMYGYDSMFYHVLVPILVRVGDAWEQGRASVAQEHFMTQLISQRFYQFFHLFPIYPHLPKVLAMCPEGEHHQVGLLLFSLFMRKMVQKCSISELIRRKRGCSPSFESRTSGWSVFRLPVLNCLSCVISFWDELRASSRICALFLGARDMSVQRMHVTRSGLCPEIQRIGNRGWNVSILQSGRLG